MWYKPIPQLVSLSLHLPQFPCNVAHTVLGTDIPDVLTPLSTRLSKRRRARADVANQVDDAEPLA